MAEKKYKKEADMKKEVDMSVAGYSQEYYYISEKIAQVLIGAKIVAVYCPIRTGYIGVPSYQAVMEFDNGEKIIWYEDSEGPSGFWFKNND
jgi:hypothetical protein